jgi:hypothetical protein
MGPPRENGHWGVGGNHAASCCLSAAKGLKAATGSQFQKGGIPGGSLRVAQQRASLSYEESFFASLQN